jgi:DegV family protein with EDD domain
MQTVHIVTDSNCHIPQSLCNELNIEVVELPYVWDGETYLDKIDMGRREFYARLRASETLPTTSGPTPASFKSGFEKALARGGSVLVIHVGQEFSSTYRTAALAKDMLSDQPVHLFDSHSNALALGFQVLAAARAARDGATLQEILAMLEKARNQTGIIFTIEDFNFLRRGGRISLGQAFFSSILDLVPIMQVENGPIEVLERVRTSRKATARMTQLVAERVGETSPVRIGILHADREADAYELRKVIEQEIQPDELFFEELNPILGIHIGPDSMGLAYSAGL